MFALPEQDPDNTTLQLRLGNLYYRADKFLDAVKCFQAAQPADAPDKELLLRIGKLGVCVCVCVWV